MKFTVEIDEFYLDSDEDLIPALEAEIKHQVVKQITGNISLQIGKLAQVIQEEQLKLYTAPIIEEQVKEFVTNGKMRDYSGEITIGDYIKKFIQNTKSSEQIEKAIKASVDSHLVELRNRYDLLFTTQLINKIKDAGYLKEEAVKMLLHEHNS